MKRVVVKECPSGIMRETCERPVELSQSIYLERLELLRQRIKDRGLDCVVLYGDREHFANIEYFSRYDCRFEEALFVIDSFGRRSIVVGNEGEAFCRFIPYDINIIRFRDFSLQGQPREGSPELSDIFKALGIVKGSRVGLSGYKYFADESRFDVPEYIVRELRRAAGDENVVNFTKELTGLPNGLRMTVRRPEEILVISYRSSKVANVMRRLLKAAKPGISEEELSGCGGVDFSPQQTHSMVNFGERSVSMGIKSPSPFVHLELGGPMSLAYSLRGSLMCRAAFAAESPEDVRPEFRQCLESHLMPYWSAVAAWYENIRVGSSGGEIYDIVHNIIGGPGFGFELNPGHYIGGDEWVNSEFRRGSSTPIHSGSHIQCDIIAASAKPVLSAICEDTVVIADSGLRAELKAACPEFYDKTTARRAFMRDFLGIVISEDVLPMSDMNAVMFPYMLNPRLMFALE